MNKETQRGVNFLELLLLAFIILKLTGFINWSWWWVLSPMWIPLTIVVVIYVGWFMTEVIKKRIKK